MDKQMERLVSLGILSKNSTSHTSPVMLITQKLTNDKCPVVDFRLLNTRILRRNTSIPLMSDVLSIFAIMDDLLVHSSKAAYWRLLEQLFKAMCKNGLNLSPKKCQLFKTKLTYMGNEFVIVEKNMTITPLRSRTEALHKIPTPKR